MMKRPKNVVAMMPLAAESCWVCRSAGIEMIQTSPSYRWRAYCGTCSAHAGSASMLQLALQAWNEKSRRLVEKKRVRQTSC
jgi:hypothetical protein